MTHNENIDIRGMVFSELSVTISSVNHFSMTGIIYADQSVEVSNADNFRIDGSIIAKSGITFKSCSGTGPDVNWGSKVLAEPPGFTWVGSECLDMGTWDEVY